MDGGERQRNSFPMDGQSTEVHVVPDHFVSHRILFTNAWPCIDDVICDTLLERRTSLFKQADVL